MFNISHMIHIILNSPHSSNTIFKIQVARQNIWGAGRPAEVIGARPLGKLVRDLKPPYRGMK